MAQFHQPPTPQPPSQGGPGHLLSPAPTPSPSSPLPRVVPKNTGADRLWERRRHRKWCRKDTDCDWGGQRCVRRTDTLYLSALMIGTVFSFFVVFSMCFFFVLFQADRNPSHADSAAPRPSGRHVDPPAPLPTTTTTRPSPLPPPPTLTLSRCKARAITRSSSWIAPADPPLHSAGQYSVFYEVLLMCAQIAANTSGDKGLSDEHRVQACSGWMTVQQGASLAPRLLIYCAGMLQDSVVFFLFLRRGGGGCFGQSRSLRVRCVLNPQPPSRSRTHESCG